MSHLLKTTGGQRGRIIRASNLPASESASVAIPAGPGHRQTEVNLIREGDIIREIEVTCSCGEVLHLICEYD